VKICLIIILFERYSIQSSHLFPPKRLPVGGPPLP